MNILIFTYDYSERTLASSFRVRNIVNYYQKCEYNVDVVAATHDGQQEVIGINSDFIEKRNFFSKIYLRAFYYPDPMAYWAEKVIRFLKNNKYLIERSDKIIVSTPPHSLQKIALWIKEQYPNKLVISDFRDAFVTNHRVRWYTPLHFNYAKKMELEIFKMIDCIVANTPTMKNNFIEKYPLYEKKIIFVPNGYSKSYVPSINLNKNSNVVIGYFGDGYGSQVSNSIYHCLTKLSKNEKVSFLTAGKGDWTVSEKISENLWKHLGIVTQQQVKQSIAGCDILLLIMPKGEKEPSPTIPLKTYEYLSSGKTLVYFGPIGDCYNLLNSQPNTYCYALNEIAEFHSKIESLKIYHCKRTEFNEKFNFNNIAEKLINMEDMF